MLTSSTIKQKIDSLWDKFWSGGISNPLTAIEQMSYLIFLKRERYGQCKYCFRQKKRY